VNKNVFKSIMVLHGDTQKTVADALDVSPQTIGDKLNGLTDFTQSEIQALAERYKLTPAQVDEIFFGGELWRA
jgi:transcriptional regulator with XRE-family HTH domain